MGRTETPIGAPCSKGHPYDRRESDGACRQCARDRKKAAYRRRVGKVREQSFVGKLKRYPGPRATAAELRELWRSQNGKCGLTGMFLVNIRPHLDHIVPVCKGGASTVDNLHYVHPMANHAKNSRSVEDFRAWLLVSADNLKAKIALESLL